MTREEILKTLGEVIDASSADAIEWDQVTEDTDLESFGLDSLAVLDLIFDIEQELGVAIPAADILGMTTMADMINYIAERQG